RGLSQSSAAAEEGPPAPAMNLGLRSAVAALLAACVGAAIIESYQQVIYDRSPKLRLRGGPFKGKDNQIHLTFSPPLEQGVDYDLTVVDDARIVLSLREGRRSVAFSPP